MSECRPTCNLYVLDLVRITVVDDYNSKFYEQNTLRQMLHV